MQWPGFEPRSQEPTLGNQMCCGALDLSAADIVECACNIMRWYDNFNQKDLCKKYICHRNECICNAIGAKSKKEQFKVNFVTFLY